MISQAFRRAALAPRTFTGIRSKHSLPDLPYAYNALEPAISSQIMELHHSKHHQTYINGLNAAEEQLASALAAGDVKQQLTLQPALKFNGGGHINHTLFWEGLSPENVKGGKLGEGKLSEQINKDFGGLEGLKTKVNAAAAGIQGSGWCWIGYNQAAKKIEIATTANQDPLIGLVPLLGIDMWEHAFYLQYKNVKPDYLKNIWSVMNFEKAEERLVAASA